MAIQSTVEAMIDGVFEPDAQRLETLNSEVRRLSRLVDALLKLSRLENRANPVEFSRVDLVELVGKVVATHQAYVEESGLEFVYQHDEAVIVYGNADMLRQATANLVSNAVRYTPEGGTIKVSVVQGDLMGKIVVQDTGIGFTAEEAKNVFSRFWRADAGRTRESGGLGIGLSVVKEIADRHNGWVRAEGRPNEGARFTIYIPLYSRAPLRKGKSKRPGYSVTKNSIKHS
jgi:signal transduction histidine kinase